MRKQIRFRAVFDFENCFDLNYAQKIFDVLTTSALKNKKIKKIIGFANTEFGIKKSELLNRSKYERVIALSAITEILINDYGFKLSELSLFFKRDQSTFSRYKKFHRKLIRYKGNVVKLYDTKITLKKPYKKSFEVIREKIKNIS